MNKHQAAALVKNTFESKFNKQNYVYFLKNLLNQFEPINSQPLSGVYIPDYFKDFIKKYERIGKYFDQNGKRIDLLIIYLEKSSSLERARSTQRNFIAGYMEGKYGSLSRKDAVIAAFVSPDESDWRFSLIKLETSLSFGPKGLSTKESFTPARRWSFLVGEHEKSHTAQSRLAPLIADDEHSPLLSELEEAFNIETVTDEFFIEYRNLFIRTKQALDEVITSNPVVERDFTDKEVNTVDLAKKLLGQIIFLYYLQKKGWFGVPRDAEWGSGSKNFLRELFEERHGTYQNFFNDILESLFYDALRIDRSHDGHYYSRFNCKIPFLNGGLFDPLNNYDWVHADVLLPNDLFSNNTLTKNGDLGDGILDIFDRYNFTVREDEPMDKEVAIDPELLGKAYEKFNAIRPDNFLEYLQALNSGKKGEESKFNRQFGVYYTPPEIVQYMCQQSLIQYLTTELEGKVLKEDLETLILHGETLIEFEQIADQKAQNIASGIQKNTNYKSTELNKLKPFAAEIDQYLLDVKICDPAVGSGAFPVGMMTEIVKTRQILAQLNNLESNPYQLKRECIENALYGVDIDSGAVEIAKLRLWLSLIVDEEDIHHIKPLPNLDYKIMEGNSLIGFPPGILFNTEDVFNLEKNKKDYLHATTPSKKIKLRGEIDISFEKLISTGKQFNPNIPDIVFDYRTHFSEVFDTKNGFDIVIANPPYVFTRKSDFSEEFKKFIETYFFSMFSNKTKTSKSNQSGKINLYILFILKSYNICKERGCVNFIVPNNLLRTTTYDLARKFVLEKSSINEIVDLGSGIFDNVTASTIIFRFTKQIKNSINKIHIITNIENFEQKKYSNHFIDQKIFLDNISYTINISAEKNELDLLNKISKGKVGLGEFCKDIIEGIVAHKHLIIDTPSKNTYPLVEGKTIKRFHLISPSKYIIWDKKNIHRPRPDYLWKIPKKIVIQRISGGEKPITAAIDIHRYKTFASVNNLILKENYEHLYEYFVALLNSNIINWFYAKSFTNDSELTVNISKTFLESIPVVVFREKIDQITNLVNKIIELKNTSQCKEAFMLEQQINQIFYEIYNVSNEDIQIIERIHNQTLT